MFIGDGIDGKAGPNLIFAQIAHTRAHGRCVKNVVTRSKAQRKNNEKYFSCNLLMFHKLLGKQTKMRLQFIYTNCQGAIHNLIDRSRKGIVPSQVTKSVFRN